MPAPLPGHSEACVCFQKLLSDGFFIDHREQFGIMQNPGLLARLIFHGVDSSFAFMEAWVMKY